MQHGDWIDVKVGIDSDGNDLLKRVRIVNVEPGEKKDTIYVRIWKRPFVL